VRYFEKGETASRAKPEGVRLGRLAQVALDCTDLDQASAFYEGCLGLERIGEVPGVLAFFDADGVSLYLQRSDEVRPNSCLYFAVEGRPGAIETAYDSLKQRGVRMGDPPHCIAKAWQGHDVWLAFFEDPFGNQLALRSDVPVGADDP
jgi:catechol 2,3-dioxygenase-like lactoylglutathione lyase family enzyme